MSTREPWLWQSSCGCRGTLYRRVSQHVIDCMSQLVIHRMSLLQTPLLHYRLTTDWRTLHSAA